MDSGVEVVHSKTNMFGYQSVNGVYSAARGTLG